MVDEIRFQLGAMIDHDSTREFSVGILIGPCSHVSLLVAADHHRKRDLKEASPREIARPPGHMPASL
jgi:hypothetical protein